MAEGDGVVYNNLKEQLLLGTIDLSADVVKLALLAGHTVNIDTHAVFADVSADEESGTGYTAGGQIVGSKAVSQDNTNDRAVFDAADVTFVGLNVGLPSHAVLYVDGATDFLIAVWELGTTASNGGNYTIQWNAVGIVTLT